MIEILRRTGVKQAKKSDRITFNSAPQNSKFASTRLDVIDANVTPN